MISRYSTYTKNLTRSQFNLPHDIRHKTLESKLKIKQKLTSSKILRKWYVHLLLHQWAPDQHYTNFPRHL